MRKHRINTVFIMLSLILVTFENVIESYCQICQKYNVNKKLS